MRHFPRKSLTQIWATLTLLMFIVTGVFAQTTQDTRQQSSNSPNDNAVAQASASRVSPKPIALSGFCSVSILEAKQWVKGSESFAVVLDGKTYLFPGEEERQTFLKDTTKYTPALGGDCVVNAVDRGLRTPGSLVYTVNHQGRLFMFSSAKEKATFMANPKKYQDVDLAYSGNCAVCKIDENQDMSGNGTFGTVYGGMRYYFPSLGHRKMFLANPSKYAIK